MQGSAWQHWHIRLAAMLMWRRRQRIMTMLAALLCMGTVVTINHPAICSTCALSQGQAVTPALPSSQLGQVLH
jgi:hypothetical protein